MPGSGLPVHAFTKKIISGANKFVEQWNKLHLLKRGYLIF
jgi:hypothetical protein